jgi:hypothetical protein
LTVSGFAELALKLFTEHISVPIRAIALDDPLRALKRMALGSVITDADNHIRVERANCCGTGCLKRIANGCAQIVEVIACDRHSPMRLPGLHG